MPRHSPTVDPELRAHQEWLGYLQPVGLVVAPAAIRDAGWVLTRSGSDLVERQQRYRDALEPLIPAEDTDLDDNGLGFSRLNNLLMEHLGWSEDQVRSDPSQLEACSKLLPELGETLKPTAVIPAVTGHGAQMLVKVLSPLTPLDRKTRAMTESVMRGLSVCVDTGGYRIRPCPIGDQPPDPHCKTWKAFTTGASKIPPFPSGSPKR